MCRSPELIAACHVLLRLLMPRHSPCALFRLIYWFSRIMQAPFGSYRLSKLFLPFVSTICFKLYLLLPCLSFALCSVFNVQTPYHGERDSAPIGTKFQHLGSLNAETCFQSGGDSRTRTDDPLLAKQVLSQLSYTPGYEIGGPKWTRTTDLTIISRVL